MYYIILCMYGYDCLRTFFKTLQLSHHQKSSMPHISPQNEVAIIKWIFKNVATDARSITIPISHSLHVYSHQSKLERDVEDLKAQLKLALSSITDLAAKYDGLQKEVLRLKNDATRNTVRRHTHTSVAVAEEAMETNKKKLKTLSCKQVRRDLHARNSQWSIKLMPRGPVSCSRLIQL